MSKEEVDISETIIIVSGVIGVLIAFIFFLFVLFYLRRKREKRKQSLLKQRYEKEMLKSQIEVQNDTLQYIGKELHDNIGQLLSVARININVVEDAIKDEENLIFIKQANELIEQTIKEIRLLSKSLDSDFVNLFGLQEMISHELERIQKTKKFETEMIVYGETYSLGYDREIILFRIVQEILNNALKHSGAKKIKVSINYLHESFSIKVEDNGKGFDYEQTIKKNINQSGSGLRNITSRSDLIGFKCDISSKNLEGTYYLLTTNQL